MSDKIEQFWRDADGADVMRVMDGQRVEARFRDEESEGWRDGEFLGGYRRYHKLAPRFLDLDGATYLLCQVYDPPAWFVNKPDPGEGYRLLEKSPPEEKEAGDEWFSYKTNDWVYAGSSKIQRADVWYRRRIANNPTSSDSSDYPAVSDSSRPLGWKALLLDEPRLASDAYWSQGCKEWVLIGNDRVEYANRDRWPAIRQVVYYDHRELRLNGVYSMPGGQTIRITAKGFEVL